MKVVVAGGTGFIGHALCESLVADLHEVVILSRRPQPPGPCRHGVWNPAARGEWEGALEGAWAVINLCGESVAEGRWSPRRKSLLSESRIQSTQSLAAALIKRGAKQTTLVNASAVGYYGDRQETALAESDTPGADFLGRLCVGWERAADAARDYGIRSILLRIGIVLAADGGALKKMLPPFRFGLGGPLGNGRQWMSWISRPDLIQLIRFCLSGNLSGPVNATAPEPVTNEEFSRTLAEVLGRPCWARVPAPVLRLALGEMAGMLLGGQRVLPRKALDAGFRFAEPDLRSALAGALA